MRAGITDKMVVPALILYIKRTNVCFLLYFFIVLWYHGTMLMEGSEYAGRGSSF